jgi:transposase
LLKRNGIESAPAKAWTEAYCGWLKALPGRGELGFGASRALESLLRQVEWLWSEIERLDGHVLALSRTARYVPLVAALRRVRGVGVLTAMVYLTEMGDLTRFANRQRVGSYLGLTPGSFETGQDADRKGHITHQGSSRVRKVLCQAVWSRLQHDENERFAYDRIVARNPKHKKIAVVARMRTLGIVLWHHGRAAQEALRAEKRDGVNSMVPPAGHRPPEEVAAKTRRNDSPHAEAAPGRTRPPLLASMKGKQTPR